MVLLWLLPTLAVVLAIVSGRLNTTHAALLGLVVAIPVAALTGRVAFGGSQLMSALARGSWIGATIAPYILGGLLFWQVAVHGAQARSSRSGTSQADDSLPTDAGMSAPARRR